MKTWRDWIRPQVAAIIERLGTSDMKKLKRALIDERPHEVRTTSHGLKIWRDEVAEQLGTKEIRLRKQRIAEDQEKGQGLLWDKPQN